MRADPRSATRERLHCPASSSRPPPGWRRRSTSGPSPRPACAPSSQDLLRTQAPRHGWPTRPRHGQAARGPGRVGSKGSVRLVCGQGHRAGIAPCSRPSMPRSARPGQARPSPACKAAGAALLGRHPHDGIRPSRACGNPTPTSARPAKPGGPGHVPRITRRLGRPWQPRLSRRPRRGLFCGLALGHRALDPNPGTALCRHPSASKKPPPGLTPRDWQPVLPPLALRHARHRLRRGRARCRDAYPRSHELLASPAQR
jgi:hypothetical protein